jgi:hypothetical protein
MKGLLFLPLTERVEFKAVLQKGNRVQIPKLVRWRFKLETDQGAEGFSDSVESIRWLGNILRKHGQERTNNNPETRAKTVRKPSKRCKLGGRCA